jgi:hypothetical protein
VLGHIELFHQLSEGNSGTSCGGRGSADHKWWGIPLQKYWVATVDYGELIMVSYFELDELVPLWLLWLIMINYGCLRLIMVAYDEYW